MKSLIFARERDASLLREILADACICVEDRSSFLKETKQRRIACAFVDVDLLSQVEGETSSFPIIGVLDGHLADTVAALELFPWLCHVVTRSLLTSALARAQVPLLVDRIKHGPTHPFLAPNAVGRVALLSSSSRRENRLERMREFFSQNGLSARTVLQVSDVAEELLTNALYDAPVDSGFYPGAVSRTQPVELQPQHACEISYGVEASGLFVRVRDPFGAFMRPRLIDVLNRCNVDDGGVTLDESRGGAGLGLWRVFSAASSLAITVIPGRLTDMLVRIETHKGRLAKQSIHAVHLFFPEMPSLDGTQGRFAADHDYDLMDDSFTSFSSA